jgi:O-antigen/teichoic acid export membrane protein
VFIIKNFLTTVKNKERSVFIWNSASAVLNAFQTVIILMVISRIDNINDAGTFVIAYALANLLIMVGRFGVRQYQASDIKEQFSFSEYFILRIFSTILMMFVSLIYIGGLYLNGSYNMEKSTVVLLICTVRAVDALEDVFHGLFQQHGRLDIGGKILTLRFLIYIIEYMILYYFTHNLIITSAFCLLTSIILFVLMNGSVMKNFVYMKKKPDRTHVKELLLDCFPLFISTFLMAYVGNAPKYSIDIVLSSYEQAQFNYIFMPVFVISLLSTFIYQPMINRLAVTWNEKKISEFWSAILRQTIIIAILTLLALAGGYLLGIPVLSLLYGVDLSSYKIELIILLLGGGALALINFFTMVITITRYQKYLIWGYLIVSICFFLAGKKIAGTHGVMGISIFYTICMIILALIFLIYIIVIAKHSKIQTTE